MIKIFKVKCPMAKKFGLCSWTRHTHWKVLVAVVCTEYFHMSSYTHLKVSIFLSWSSLLHHIVTLHTAALDILEARDTCEKRTVTKRGFSHTMISCLNIKERRDHRSHTFYKLDNVWELKVDRTQFMVNPL